MTLVGYALVCTYLLVAPLLVRKWADTHDLWMVKGLSLIVGFLILGPLLILVSASSLVEGVLTVDDIYRSIPLAFDVLPSIVGFLILQNWIPNCLRSKYPNSDFETVELLGFGVATVLALAITAIPPLLVPEIPAPLARSLLLIGLGAVWWDTEFRRVMD